jgi:hypothetical protein
MSAREEARQEAVIHAEGWLSRSFHDFRYATQSAARGVKGEARIGLALGLLNAIETMSLMENE